MDPYNQSNARRPRYPPLSATTQTSTLSASSTQSSTNSSDKTTAQTVDLAQARSSAPMPSPTTASGAYFGSLYSHFDSGQQGTSSRQQDQTAAHLSAYQRQLEDQRRLQQHLVATHQQAVAAQRDAATLASRETTQYRADYRLLAEAARRAELAILERDLEGIDLR